jgi:hypothetical protein
MRTTRAEEAILPQIDSVLTLAERRAFGAKMKALYDAGCAKEPGRATHPGFGARLKAKLNTPNLAAKLTQYTTGKPFPTADKVLAFAEGIGADRLAMLHEAGYYSQLIKMIFELSCYHEPKKKIDERRAQLQAFPVPTGLEGSAFTAGFDRWPKRIAIQYAVGLFPHSAERRAEYTYGLVAMIFDGIFADAQQARGFRKPLPRFLKNALEALDARPARLTTRSNIASEWVREWAYSVDPQLTKEAEQMMLAHLAPLPITVHSSLYGRRPQT